MRKVNGSGWTDVLLDSLIGALESQIIVLAGWGKTAWYMEQEGKRCGMIILAHCGHMASYVPRKFAPPDNIMATSRNAIKHITDVYLFFIFVKYSKLG